MCIRDRRESVQTSNGSVSDLSALTEELSATMQDISDNASRINENTESVAGEVKSIDVYKRQHVVRVLKFTMIEAKNTDAEVRIVK